MSSNGVADPFLAPSQALNALRLNAMKLIDQQSVVNIDVQSQLKRQFQLLRRTKKVVDQWVGESNPQFFRHHQQSLVNVRTQLDELPLHCLLSALDADHIHDKRFVACQQLANSQRLASVYQTFIELLWRAARCDVRDARFVQKQEQILGHLQQILEQVLEELNYAIDADNCPETRSRWPQWSMPWGQRKTDKPNCEPAARSVAKPARAIAVNPLEQARLSSLRSLLSSNGLNVVGFDQRLCATFTELDGTLSPLLGSLAAGEHANAFMRELAKLGKLPAGPLLQQLEAFTDDAKARVPQGEFSVTGNNGKASRYSWSLQAGSDLAAETWRLVLKRKASVAADSTPPLLVQKAPAQPINRPSKNTAPATRSADPLWSEFCSDAAKALREMQTLAGDSHSFRRQEGLNSVLAIAHLLRGDASMLGLKALVEQFAQIEHCAANLLAPDKGESRGESAAVLGTLIARASVVLDDIRKRKEGALSADVQGVQERLVRFAAVLAKAQGKLAELKVQGDIDAIPKALRMPLLHIWVQWVHNALTHGNEGPMVRQSLGKANALQLNLNLRQEQGWLNIHCKDDGLGFDFDKCRQRLMIEGCSKEIAENLPPSALIEDLLRLRPRDHMRAEQARGMGLAACAELIRRLGGTLQIQTKHQQGVGLQIRIPLQ